MDGWMDGWVDGWMDGWMDEWVDGWVDDTTANYLDHEALCGNTYRMCFCSDPSRSSARSSAVRCGAVASRTLYISPVCKAYHAVLINVTSV